MKWFAVGRTPALVLLAATLFGAGLPAAAQSDVARRPLPERPHAAASASVPMSAATLVVPDLRGLDCRAARLRARDHGFDAVQCTSALPPAPALPLGRAFAQSPAPGRELAAPRALALSIAAAAVPDVVGQDLLAARQRIEAAGLAARVDRAHADGAFEVATQTPAGGTLYTEPAPVQLALRRTARAPALVDLSCRQAGAALLQAGLNSACRLMAQWLALSAPRVFAQSIGAGTRVGAGALVASQARAAPWPVIAAALLAALGVLVALAWPRPRLRWQVLPDARPATELHFVAPMGLRAPLLAWRIDADRSGAPLLRFG